MRAYLLIIPIALLVAYSQVIVKWRTKKGDAIADQSFIEQLLNFLTDPVILSAYVTALFASFAWLYVVTKLPLVTAFPVYIGITFAMVMVGGWLFLGEQLNFLKIFSIALIFLGIILGVRSGI